MLYRSAQENSRRSRRRELEDRVARRLITIGGISASIASFLIFAYLLTIVFPLFQPGEITLLQRNKDHVLPLYTVTDEYVEGHVAVHAGGSMVIQSLDNPSTPSVTKKIAAISSYALVGRTPFSYVWGTPDGRAILVENDFRLRYDAQGKRQTLAVLRGLYGTLEEPLTLSDKAIVRIAARADEEHLVIAYFDGDALRAKVFSKQASLVDETVQIREEEERSFPVGAPITSLFLTSDLRWLLALDNASRITAYSLGGASRPQVLKYDADILSAAWLLGENTLLIGDRKGRVAKLFVVNNQWQLVERIAVGDKAIEHIVSNHQLRSFAAADSGGRIVVFYAPSATRLMEYAFDGDIEYLNFTPRGDALIVHGDGQREVLSVDEAYPEVNMKSLWMPIHYEGYDRPRYIWQSSAATQDFEPKLSLTPLVSGTVKAAFYAMLVAIPLALMGGIYTAFFMSPAMRRLIKPTVEIMEALPTVILGFLAGLWLAPLIEEGLLAFFFAVVMMPAGVLLFGWLWSRAPVAWQQRIGEGWRAALLIPVLIALAGFAIVVADPAEKMFFDGSFRQFISDDMGITYDQRNALIIGIAMGFAVIPTIFSIAEDAIFSVPRHLVNGSLALGASSWQTLVGVVLPTASPGMFSAVMIGFGRAVGETMIVLMATGNTPVIDWNIFEGMRTLAANIAVEMPESEVGSSHYRVLFLAALVLFLFTFIFNTGAEIIRQRLRRRYSNL